MMSSRTQIMYVVVIALVLITLVTYALYSDSISIVSVKDRPGEDVREISTIEELKAMYKSGGDQKYVNDTKKNSTAQVEGNDNSIVEVNITQAEQLREEKLINVTSGGAQDSVNFDFNKYKSTWKLNTASSSAPVTFSLYASGFNISNNKICPNFGAEKKVVIVITSAPEHEAARRAIRMTWGHWKLHPYIAMAFIVGYTPNKKLQEQLQAEAFQYEDIIQGNFVDTYDNLTLKTLSMFQWILENCAMAHMLLKTDDDMFINVSKLLSLVDTKWNVTRTVYGRLAVAWGPNRDPQSKYYISPEQFAGNVFPEFTTGPAYLMSMDCVQDLFLKSLEHVFVRLEDVLITGIVAQSVGISRINEPAIHNTKIPFHTCGVKNAIAIHDIGFEDQFVLWKKLFEDIACT